MTAGFIADADAPVMPYYRHNKQLNQGKNNIYNYVISLIMAFPTHEVELLYYYYYYYYYYSWPQAMR
jgi:hypothetical protein